VNTIRSNKWSEKIVNTTTGEFDFPGLVMLFMRLLTRPGMKQVVYVQTSANLLVDNQH